MPTDQHTVAFQKDENFVAERVCMNFHQSQISRKNATCVVDVEPKKKDTVLDREHYQASLLKE